jgi:hypothetical protein
MRGFKPHHLALMLALTLLVLCSSRRAFAYAWMLKHGLSQCIACHTDPSGGETLTLMGRSAAQNLLTFEPASGDRISPLSQFGFGLVREPDDVHLGGSYRHLFVYAASHDGTPTSFSNFPMQLDVYGSATLSSFVLGGSFGVARGIEGSSHVRGAQLNRELGTGWIVLSRSHYAGAWLDRYTMLRAGRLNLPFGVRIPEHVAWVREATRTDRESDQQHGVALAYTRERWRSELMAIVGNYQLYPDRYRERGYSLSLEYLLNPGLALGASSLLTWANEDRFTQARRALRHAQSLHARAALSDRWVLLAEVDLLKQAGRALGYAGWMQADYEPLRGLHVLLTGELLDQGQLEGGVATPGNGEARAGAWASLAWYCLSHGELRLDALQRRESPFTVQAQLHLFL